MHAIDIPAPKTPADCARAERRLPLTLVPDRIMRQATRTNRQKLLLDFDA